MLCQYLAASLLAASSLVYAAPVDKAEQSLVRRAGPGLCNWPGITQNAVVGKVSPDSAKYCESRWPNLDFISKITAFDNGNTITGLIFQYRSGIRAEFGGNLKGDGKSIELQQGEIITSAELAGNGRGTRLGKIRISTDKQKDTVIGGTHTDAKWYPADVQSGLLVAASVQHGEEIDYLALDFLAGKVESLKIKDIKFKTDPAIDGPPTNPQTLSEVHYWNADLPNSTFVFESSKGVEKEEVFTSSTVKTFGTSHNWEVKVGLPVIEAKASHTFTWSISTTEQSSISRKWSDTLKWSLSDKLAAGQGATCRAASASGVADFPYTASIELVMDSGTKFRYDEPGTFHTVQWAKVQQSCERDDKPYIAGISQGVVKAS